MQNILKEREMITLYGGSAKEFKTLCKRLSKGKKIPSRIVVWFQDKGWMDSELMNQYIDYLGHLEKSVKEKFCDYGFDLGIIPDGLTSLCQPLDVVINKPFKANLLEDFDNEIIDISDDDLEDGINDNLENDISDDNLEDDISCDDSDIGINE
ncbi:hypothetical protein RhiirC2_791870 [Rhizophagus irregularis]|uniref:DDE-1 domain-containing protein n=1 Tax=Rhizophagus irregularis TaxID=588596 RepID=A0A2N1MIC8_9GLOM|nr:hypothetical protein RhiirC2_791870 [Rhizophagus irregularis]